MKDILIPSKPFPIPGCFNDAVEYKGVTYPHKTVADYRYKKPFKSVP